MEPSLPLAAYNDPPSLSATDGVAGKEREQRLTSARKKLKDYRLKQAALASPPSISPSFKRTSTQSVIHASPHSRQHSRQHSRTQSRSSLAAVLAGPVIEDTAAHRRRISTSNISTVVNPPALESRICSEGLSQAAPKPESASASVQVKGSWNSQPAAIQSGLQNPAIASGHNRKPSRHRRRDSVATRRESMEIMGGLNKPNAVPATDSMGGPFGTPLHAREEVDLSLSHRQSTLSILEGRVRAPSREINLPSFSDDGQGLILNRVHGKRLSLGNNGPPPRSPSAVFAAEGVASPTVDASPSSELEPKRKGLGSRHDRRGSLGLGLGSSTQSSSTASLGGMNWGGNGGMGTVRDLGSVVEEEEEEDGSQGCRSGTTTPLNAGKTSESSQDLSPTRPFKSTPPVRKRPQSLAFSMSDGLPSGSAVTCQSGSPRRQAHRPLRTLSLSGRPSQHSGLRSLTLGSPSTLEISASSTISISPIRERRRSSVLGSPLPSTVNADESVHPSNFSSSSGLASVSIGSAITNHPKRRSSYTKAVPPSPADQFHPSSVKASSDMSLESLPNKMNKQPTQITSRQLFESISTNACDHSCSDASRRSSHVCRSLVADEDDFRKELEARLADAEGERDTLLEDVDGWRSRVSDLERQLLSEKMKVDHERKENLVARERIRKLSDRLASATTASAEQNESSALASAQAKVIGEMRDQIFALAGALERERADHQDTREKLQEAQVRLQSREYQSQYSNSSILNTPNPVETGPARSVLGHHDSDVSAFSSGTSFGSNIDTAATTDVSFIDEEHSQNMAPSPGLQQPCRFRDERPVGGLDTLAEEDEDESLRESTQGHFQGHLFNSPHGRASITSAPSEESPKTPNRDDEPSLMSGKSHQRSASFIRQWAFPMGPVPQHKIAGDDDHCFFFRPNSVEISLPPLEPDTGALEVPEFLTSYLHHDDCESDTPLSHEFTLHHMRRPSSPRPAQGGNSAPDTSSHRRQFSGAIPPPSRSAQLSAALSTISTVSDPICSPTIAPRRLSLQNISNWVGSYMLTGPPSAASKIMLTCGNEDDVASLAAGHSQDMRQLLPALDRYQVFSTVPSSPAFVKPNNQPTPKASRLNALDFTSGYSDLYYI